jgi:glucoamylase
VVTLGFAELYFCLAAAIGSGAAIHATRDNVDFLDAIGGEPLSSLGPLHLDAAQRHRLFLGLLKKGDAIMATVQRYTPATGELSEQFDQDTGEQRSAKNLGWSYAAFVTAFAARKRACACEQALASSR